MTNNTLQIRPATPADLTRIVELENIMRRPNLTLEDFQRQESERGTDRPYVRFVAERDGQVIGVAGGGQQRWLIPQQMWMAINIDPAFRGQGVGKALYQALQPFYEEHQPETLRAVTVDDDHTALAWTERLGFRVVEHSIRSELDITQFDSCMHADLMQRLQAAGVRFVSFDKLRTPVNEQQLFELFEETGRDVPFSAGRTKLTLEGFCKRFLDDPTAWLEAIVVAIDQDDQWLGFTNIFRSTTNPKHAELGYTGVRQTARGQGLALALKIAGLEVLEQQGIKTISTINHATNEPILAINRKMGYVRKEGLLTLSKTFAEPTEQ